MPKQYQQEAIETARELYCRHGGKNHDLIEQGMKKAGYVGWKRKNLYDTGSGKNARLGWITKHGFERSLEIYVEKLTTKVMSDEQSLYVGIKRVRETLERAVHSGEATKDEVYQYRDFCKLEIDARKNLDLSRDNLETFVAGFEKLTVWLGEIDPKTAAGLVKNGERLAEMAEAHYGKADEVNDGAIDREDEGGNEPFSLLT